MSMSDPIADMLTRVRNAQLVQIKQVSMPSSKIKIGIAEVLREEGYITDFSVHENAGKPILEIGLKYVDGSGVIARLDRISKPSLRCYRGKDGLPKVIGGLGIAIVSTSHGIMTDHRARKEGHGGEVLCVVA